MKTTGTCPKCESTKIVRDAKAVDAGDNSGGEAKVLVYKFPNALIFGGAVNSTVSAWVCAECGFIEYYADSPRALWENYLAQEK